MFFADFFSYELVPFGILVSDELDLVRWWQHEENCCVFIVWKFLAVAYSWNEVNQCKVLDGFVWAVCVLHGKNLSFTVLVLRSLSAFFF